MLRFDIKDNTIKTLDVVTVKIGKERRHGQIIKHDMHCFMKCDIKYRGKIEVITIN